MSSVNVDAVEEAIESAGTGIPAAYGPLVELVLALARQMDTSGAEGPSARLAAAYLSALKDFGKIAVAAPSGSARPQDPLEAFRAEFFRPVERPRFGTVDTSSNRVAS
jgi:hypothetical protein